MSRLQRATIVSIRQGTTALATAIAAALAHPVPVCAADASADAGTLEEVVVTASRRSERVTDVPHNISAYDSEIIDRSGITNLQDLTRMVPGLVAPDLGARATSTNSQFIIRGLNAANSGNSYVTQDLSVPLVSTYIDDVPMFVNLTLSDIDRVEVLRGPQGTLYGSGAVGGTVRLLHKKPERGIFSAQFDAQTSDTAHADGENYSGAFIVNVPAAENVAFRASAGYDRFAGFINAPYVAQFDSHGQPVLANPAEPLTSPYVFGTEKGIDRSHTSYVRASLLAKFSDSLDALLSFQHQDDFSNGF